MESTDVKARYQQKVTDFCGGMNPYAINDGKDPLPRSVDLFDVYNYCVNKDSAYTHQSFKAYKSLEAYQMFENGWIQSMNCKVLDTGTSIVLSKVKHSQRFRLKVLQCWVVADADGIILCAHCDCMAGLGEVCSHVAAVLFALDAWRKKSDGIDYPEAISCTDVLSKWLVPSTKDIEMAAIEDIIFNAKCEKRNELEQSVQLETSEEVDPQEVNNLCFETENVEEVIDSVLSKMFEKSIFCPIMALRKPFSAKFVEKPPQILFTKLQPNDDELRLDTISLFLPSLFTPIYESLSYENLVEIAENIHLTYSQDEIDYIEEKTREQSQCKLWYRFRAGRITGSVFKSVCRTSIKTPAISTVEKICFPERGVFKSDATEWGKQNEGRARSVYFESMSSAHTNFTLKETGLMINNRYPFCGVSPDAVVQCDCCGRGVVEIKCPYLMRFGETKTYMKKKDCALIVDENGSYSLDVKHEYYYQVQMELFITDSDFCDFVVWNPRMSIIVRVYKDDGFWNVNYPKAENFFKYVILPELLATHFTSKKEIKIKLENS